MKGLLFDNKDTIMDYATTITMMHKKLKILFPDESFLVTVGGWSFHEEISYVIYSDTLKEHFSSEISLDRAFQGMMTVRNIL